MVCISGVIALFVLNQFDNLGNIMGGGASSANAGAPSVFVDTPGF
jgi:hypothetical protein